MPVFLGWDVTVKVFHWVMSRFSHLFSMNTFHCSDPMWFIYIKVFLSKEIAFDVSEFAVPLLKWVGTCVMTRHCYCSSQGNEWSHHKMIPFQPRAQTLNTSVGLASFILTIGVCTYFHFTWSLQGVIVLIPWILMEFLNDHHVSGSQIHTVNSRLWTTRFHCVFPTPWLLYHF